MKSLHWALPEPLTVGLSGLIWGRGPTFPRSTAITLFGINGGGTAATAAADGAEIQCIATGLGRGMKRGERILNVG